VGFEEGPEASGANADGDQRVGVEELGSDGGVGDVDLGPGEEEELGEVAGVRCMEREWCTVDNSHTICQRSLL
jgi:hypothetical protein